MQKYKSNITTTSGAAVRGVPVSILASDGQLASIYLDRLGVVTAQNPLTTDSQGVFYFYAKNGRYSLRTIVEGITITDDDVVLMNDPEEIATAGPIAEAVAAATAAALRAEEAVASSGVPDLVATAQNAVVDANAALSMANSAAQIADAAKGQSEIAKGAAESAQGLAEQARAGANAARVEAEEARDTAAAYAESVNPDDLKDRSNHTGTQTIATISELQAELDAKAAETSVANRLATKADATSVAQAIAMAQTFTAVPVVFQAWVIFVTQPHFRTLVWNGTKYVRAPWHPAGDIFYSLAAPAKVTHGIQLRSDVLYETEKYPDIAELYGFTGPTFTLWDGRTRVIRGPDLGKGTDAALVNGYLQEDAVQNWQGSVTFHGSGTSTVLAGVSGGAEAFSPRGGYKSGETTQGATSYDGFYVGPGTGGASRVASETRVKSLIATPYMYI